MERLLQLSYGAAGLLLVAQIGTLLALMWVRGRIHMRYGAECHALITNEGPEIHSRLPRLSATEIGGQHLQIDELRGRQTALLLLSLQCIPCERVLASLRGVQKAFPYPLDFLLAVEGDADKVQAAIARHGIRATLIADPEATLRANLGVERTPYGLLIDENGVVRMKGVISDRGQLEGLLARRGRSMGGLVWRSLENATDTHFPEDLESAFAPS